MIYKVIFIFIVITSLLSAQTNNTNSLTGKVIDSTSLLPISNVSVYLSGTTIGTVTDNNGAYRIEKIPAGKFELVISMIGYSPKIQQINFLMGSEKINKDYSLEPKAIEMAPILINDEHTSEWKSNLKTFKKYFLGQTDLSDECTIENQNEIILTRDSIDALRARCNSPLLIINHALGYNIECLLMQFYCNEKKNEWSVSYAPKFTDLKPVNEIELKQWQQNREDQYLNSLHRFLRALIKNKDVDYDYVIKFSGVRADSRFYGDPSKTLDSLFFKENILYQELSKSYILNFGMSLYEVQNLLTREQSFFQLPYGSAEIDQTGFPIDPFSIHVSGKFSEMGLANSLPMFYGEEQKE